MLRDITLGQYLPGQSLIHRLDPRIKITAVMVYMIALFTVDNAYGVGMMIGFSIVLVLLSQIPLHYFIKGIRPIALIIVLTVLLQVFLTPGEVIWQWGIFQATKEGVVMATFMAVRLILLVSITSILTLTTTPMVLTDGIEQMLNPFRPIGVPAHELAMMMTIALRSIPTLIEETDKIIKAQSARGADFESGNVLRRAQALLPILVPLFLSAFKRADELALAMGARCYRGGAGRTKLHSLQFGRLDLIAALVLMTFLGLAIASRLWL